MENNDNFFRTNAVHFSFIEICAIYLGDKCSKFLWELCVCELWAKAGKKITVIWQVQQ